MKIIVIGPQLSGKTTLVKYLCAEHPEFNISEMDQEILSENNNHWPKDNIYKDEVLVPKIFERILAQDSMLFFANYLSIDLAEEVKKKGFRIILLALEENEFKKRNKYRMTHENYDDASRWLPDQLENHKELIAKNLIDKTISAGEPTEKMAEAILRG